YIENIHDSTTGGFTIPMPTTYEELRPFLEGAEISGLHDMRIWEIRSEINGLGNAMYDHVAKVMTPELFDELNFLAHRLSQLANLYPPHYQVIDMHLEAVLEAKRHIGSIAEIINLTENLEKFEILPAFDARSYGEALAEIDADAHYMGIDALRNSGDKNLVDLVSYIEKLEKNLDHKAYGKSAMKEEDGVFTRNGYLLWEGAEFITPYNGQQDIPVEYRVFTDPDEVIRPILKVKNADIAETLIKLHAVCNDRMCAADVIRPIIAGESKDYLMSINGYDDLRLFDAMDAYKRGSEAFKVFTLGR
ncbi:MAG: hypothetical protein FWE20_10140, partial [Defluviitaleaceae bacterium]|nr:hypothetical protein [Defluviitaleaceae bacterium]